MNTKSFTVAAFLIFIAVIYGLMTWTASSDRSLEEKGFSLGVEGYIYGYPLVVMDAAKQAQTQANDVASDAIINTFQHYREQIPSNNAHAKSPNLDTLLSTAWLDLSTGPLLFHIPDTTGRYYFIEMLDGWTSLFANPGTRTIGSKSTDYVIVGPDWQEVIPPDMPQLKASTNMALISLHIQCFGADDYAAAQALQDQFSLAPMGSSTVFPPVLIASAPPSTPSAALVSDMTPRKYFDTFERLLVTNPPSPADSLIMEQLSSVEVFQDRVPERMERDPATQRGLDRSAPAALEKIRAAIPSTYKMVNGWETLTTEIGTYGTNYLLRAAVAAADLGMPLLQDAVYPATSVDGENQPLNGGHSYTLHFAKGMTPPVNAFWSLTMYNKDHTLVDNPLQRYSLQSEQTLHYNADGSLDIIIQKDAPKETQVNWLPSPEGDFTLILRMYWPKPEVLDGIWSPPAVTRAP